MRPGRQSSLIFTNIITCTCGIKNNHRCLRLIGLETIKNSSLNNVMIHLKQGQTKPVVFYLKDTGAFLFLVFPLRLHAGGYHWLLVGG